MAVIGLYLADLFGSTETGVDKLVFCQFQEKARVTAPLERNN